MPFFFAWEESFLNFMEHPPGRKGWEVVTMSQTIHGKPKEGKVQFPTEEHPSPSDRAEEPPEGSLCILGEEGE